MVWRQLRWFHDCQCHEFWLRFAVDEKFQTFSQLRSKTWHGLAPMGQQEPASHCNTTYETVMEDMQWSGGNSDGFMTANAMSFGSDLQMNSVKLQANCSPKLGMAWHQWDGRIQHHIL
jgi:hypothetical protein